MPPERIGGLLVQMMFAYVENTFFAESWWNERPMLQQQRIRRLANLTVPDVKHRPYSLADFVPWSNVRIERAAIPDLMADHA
jgi:hypothetical protein